MRVCLKGCFLFLAVKSVRARCITSGDGDVTITNCPVGKTPTVGRVAQLAEQLTLNQ